MRYILFIITLVTLASCRKENTNGDGSPPEIYDLGVVGDPFRFADTASKVWINFKLLARDKKFDNPDQPDAVNLKEFRSDTLYREFKLQMPEIPSEMLEGAFFEADISLPLKGIFFTPRFDTIHVATMRDTLYFELYVKDNDGKESNVLTTKPLYIQRF